MKYVVYVIAPMVVVCILVVAASAQSPQPRSGQRGFDFGGAPEFDRSPVAKNDGEKRALAVLDEMTKGTWYLNVTTMTLKKR